MSAQLDIFEAIRQRDEGITQVIENADARYRDKLIAAIEVLAAKREIFTSDDVRELAGDPPASCSPNLVGAIFNHGARVGLIRTVGFTRSARVIGHNNVVRQWRGQ